MDLFSRVVFSDTIFAQEIDGEMVLLDTQSENYFGLDKVGSSIWYAIEAENGLLERVLRRLLEEYDVEENVLKHDLLVFVEQLAQSGLVKVVD